MPKSTAEKRMLSWAKVVALGFPSSEEAEHNIRRFSGFLDFRKIALGTDAESLERSAKEEGAS